MVVAKSELDQVNITNRFDHLIKALQAKTSNANEDSSSSLDQRLEKHKNHINNSSKNMQIELENAVR